MLRKVVAGAAFAMISRESYHPYDLKRFLEKYPRVKVESLRDDSGHNIVHRAIIEAKEQYFELIFYLGQWDVLVGQTVDCTSSQYYGLDAKQLTERLLPTAKGPQG